MRYKEAKKILENKKKQNGIEMGMLSKQSYPFLGTLLPFCNQNIWVSRPPIMGVRILRIALFYNRYKTGNCVMDLPTNQVPTLQCCVLLNQPLTTTDVEFPHHCVSSI
jgi:hypothetical protein